MKANTRREVIAGIGGSCVVALLPRTVWSQAKPPKRIFIVQSQEQGHPCGQPQADGVLEGLAAYGWKVGENLSVRHHYMDLYRTNTTADLLREDGAKALKEIEAFRPDVLFALDDASIQFVMMPLVGRTELPIVFSGMNARPEVYNAQKKYMDSWKRPGGQVTGVYERLYSAEALRVMTQAIPSLRGAKAVMITDMSVTGAAITKQFELELKDVTDVRWEVRRVRDWAEYTALIESLNDDPAVKAIYPIVMTASGPDGKTYTVGDVYDWTLAHSRKPEMAANYFFARMGLFGGAVVNFGAMGRLAGQKGAQILAGAKPGDLPIEDAVDYAIVFNIKRARDLGIEIPAHVLAAAHAVYKDDLVPLKGKELVYDPRTRTF